MRVGDEDGSEAVGDAQQVGFFILRSERERRKKKRQTCAFKVFKMCQLENSSFVSHVSYKFKETKMHM